MYSINKEKVYLKPGHHIVLMLFSMLLFTNYAFAQSVIFSSDQWPKRWERAMQHHSINAQLGHPQRQSSNFKRVNHSQKSQQGWGQKSREKGHTRSRTPDYHYQRHNFSRAVPLSNNYSSGYGIAPDLTSGYYTRPVPLYPNVYSGQGLLGYGGYGVPAYGQPGLGLPGLGLPGVGSLYPTPLYMAPGVYSGGIYQGGIYQGGVYPGGIYPGGIYPGGIYQGGIFPW